AEYLRERLLGLEGRDEQGLDQVRVRLQRKPAAFAVVRWLERVEPGRDRVRFPWPDPDHFRAWQSARHQPVLGLGRLDHQPRDAAFARGLKQTPDGLRLAGPGRAADEHVPVERIGGDGERTGGHQVPVEDLAEPDAAGRRLGGDVELGAQREADTGYLRR